MEIKLENKSKQAASPWVPPFLSDEWWKHQNPNNPLKLVLTKVSLYAGCAGEQGDLWGRKENNKEQNLAIKLVVT